VSVPDFAESARRVDSDVALLARAPYSSSPSAVRRYAFLPELERTLEWVAERLRALGFTVDDRPLGTLVARNVAPGTPSIGVGSHLDSVREGGAWDGTLGVMMALELARLNAELGLGLPLTVIAWLEEEGAGFGQMLLGSRIAVGVVGEADLREKIVSLDDGRPFWDQALAAGYDPLRWRECAAALDGLVAWIEPHIEQGRVLEERSLQVGVVTAIAGYVHADLELRGRADHAGATPMGLRADALAGAAETVLAAERAAEAVTGATATVGELEVDPGVVNVIPGVARLSLDVRAADDAVRDATFERAVQDAREACVRRGLTLELRERQRFGAVRLHPSTVDALTAAAETAGVRWTTMVSGAAHDTACVASRVPSAMLFLPCRDGISHHPAESVERADIAAGMEVLLGAVTQAAGTARAA
jgi:hydantoinase/carbamoylase family amidase